MADKRFSDFPFQYSSDESSGFWYVQNLRMTTILQKNVPLPYSGCRSYVQGDTAVKFMTRKHIPLNVGVNCDLTVRYRHSRGVNRK